MTVSMARAVARKQGNVYVTGATNSTDFPGYPPESDGYFPFVTKLNAAGSALVYSTVFGTGQRMDYWHCGGWVGNAYVTGSATYKGLPLIPTTPICTYQGGTDAFIIKFNQAGNEMLYSTYLGGTCSDSRPLWWTAPEEAYVQRPDHVRRF